MAKQTETFPDDEFFKTHTAASFQRLLGINNGNPETKKTSFLARFICKVARLVEKLKAVPIPTPWHTGTPANEEWIRPKVYNVASKEPSAMEKIARGVQTVHDMFRFALDHVRRLFR